MYSLIGSGLQFKFGQTTLARQDITRSIPARESDALLETIRRLVSDTDPDGAFFRIEDTGLDIEIILTIEGDAEGTKDFDKGDGIRFLDQDMGLDMAGGPCLICGDTGSDAPMVDAATNIAQETHAVFVTSKEDLRNRVRGVCPDAVFVTEPDALVMILNNLGQAMA